MQIGRWLPSLGEAIGLLERTPATIETPPEPELAPDVSDVKALVRVVDPTLPAVVTEPEIEKKSTRASRAIIQFLGPKNVIWTANNYEGYSREGYARNPYVYRAISILAGALSEVPLVLNQHGEDGKKERINDHPLLDFLEDPCPLSAGRAEFFEKHFAYYLLSGNSFMEKVGPNSGPPRELYSHRPDRMKIIRGTPYEPIAGYTYILQNAGNQNSGYEPLFPREKILHQKTFHPWDDWYGMSPMSAAANSVDQSNESKAWNVAMLQNASRPSGFFKIKEGVQLDETDMYRLRAFINEQYTGSRNAGKPPLLEADIEWQSVSLSPADMDWLNGQKLSSREIGLVYGVPSELMVDSSDQEQQAYDAALAFMYKATVLPLMKRFLYGFNKFVTADFGDDLRLEIDRNRVDALQIERQAVWERISGATFLTENEKREAVGYDTVEWGDCRVFPSSMVEVGEDGTIHALLPMAGGPGGQSGSGGVRGQGNGGGRPSGMNKKKHLIPETKSEVALNAIDQQFARLMEIWESVDEPDASTEETEASR